MKEHPILFSTPMVQAILNGRKTQTRRIINPQPRCSDNHISLGYDPDQVKWAKESFRPVLSKGFLYCGNCGEYVKFNTMGLRVPYGQVGDILWVRETWMPLTKGFMYKADGLHNPKSPMIKWKPSIFMPKEVCRIKLLVKNIRVERLQGITESDAIAEGIHPDAGGWKSYEIIHSGKHKGEVNPHTVVPNKSPITSYKELWESINGLSSWDINPLVWVIEFKTI